MPLMVQHIGKRETSSPLLIYWLVFFCFLFCSSAALWDKGTYINLNGLMANLPGQPMMHDRVTLETAAGAFPRRFPESRDTWQNPRKRLKKLIDIALPL